MKTLNMSEFKRYLETQDSVSFRLADGTTIPPHFHITEAGLSSKHMMDCGGQVRNEQWINMQIWVSGDTEHRLNPKKLLNIINKTESLYNPSLPLEIEYQTNTIGRYNLTFEAGYFVLSPKQTACLAQENCGTNAQIRHVSQTESANSGCCSTGMSCC